MANYTIRYQTNPDSDLDGPGVITTTYQLQEEEVDGVIKTLYALFQGSAQRLVSLQGPQGLIDILYVATQPGAHSTLLSPVEQRALPEENEATWQNFVWENNATAEELKDFVALLRNGPTATLVTFDDISFVRGAVLVCQWFNRDRRKVVTRAHYRGEPVDLFA